MKLFLSSHTYALIPAIKNLQNSTSGKIFLIPNARDYLPDKEYKTAISTKLAELTAAGLDISLLDLKQYFQDPTSLKDLFLIKSTLIFLAIGGDPFFLNTALKLSSLDTLIKEHVSDSDLIYAGSSAGAIITTTDLTPYLTAQTIHAQIRAKYNAPLSTDGLGLIKLFPAPHADEPDFANELLPLLSNLRAAQKPILHLTASDVVQTELNLSPNSLLRSEKSQLFERWNSLKQRLDEVGRLPAIKEGEIWWTATGENIGSEINGKNSKYSRPVLILKKLSRYTFMGIPLTSQVKTGSWYVNFIFKDKTEYAAVCQARVMSVSRLYTKIGNVPESDLEKVRAGFLSLYATPKHK